MASIGHLFLNPVMLVGLGAAALPLVLHLLSRARYRSVDWGAMMFLHGADSRQRQSTQVKQWILLLLRMGVVGLLAMALARPIVSGSWAAGLSVQQGAVTAVIAVDCSASMSANELARTRFDDARQAAMRIIDNLRAGDRAMLLTLGLDPPDEGDGDSDNGAGADVGDDPLRPTGDLEALKRRLARLAPGARQADVAQCLAQAADLLDRYAPPQSNREIYLIVDRQAVSWRQVDSAFAQSWRLRTRAAGPPLRLIVVPVGGEQRDNVAVESIAVLNPPAIVGQACELDIRVRNFGDIPRPAWPLRVLRGDSTAADEMLLSTTLNLRPNESASVRVPVTFEHVGLSVITARAAPAAGPPADDALGAVVPVGQPIRVLLISGDERGGDGVSSGGVAGVGAAAGFRSEGDFARAALMPFATAGQPGGADPAIVDVLPADKWADADFQDYAVLVLANLSQITQVQARDIDRFVRAGGGLLVAPGRLSRVQNYNAMLGELLGAMLEAPDADAGATQLMSFDRDHPVFRFLSLPGASTPSASIARHLRALPPRDDRRSRVLASYRDGSPFLVESSLGLGRVLLMTTSLDADWNALPLSNFYLPFVQSAVRYLAADAMASHNLLPGQPIERWFDAADDQIVSASVRVPGGDGGDGGDGGGGERVRAAEVRRFADRDTVRFSDTRAPGTYVLRYATAGGAGGDGGGGGGSERTEPFVVRPPPDESDLTPLNPQQWSRLERDLGFERVHSDASSLEAATRGARSVRELWPILLAIVGILSAGELLLARIWSEEDRA